MLKFSAIFTMRGQRKLFLGKRGLRDNFVCRMGWGSYFRKLLLCEFLISLNFPGGGTSPGPFQDLRMCSNYELEYAYIQ